MSEWDNPVAFKGDYSAAMRKANPLKGIISVSGGKEKNVSQIFEFCETIP